IAQALKGTDPLTRGKINDAVTAAFSRILTAAAPTTADGKRPLRFAEMSTPQKMSYAASLKAALNAYLAHEGRPAMKLQRPLTAHPNLELYVSPNSPHPLKKMGC